MLNSANFTGRERESREKGRVGRQWRRGGMEADREIQEGKRGIVESKGPAGARRRPGKEPIGVEEVQATAYGGEEITCSEIQQVGAAAEEEEQQGYVCLSSLIEQAEVSEEELGEAEHQINTEIQHVDADADSTGLFDARPEDLTEILLSAEMHDREEDSTASHFHEEHLLRWLCSLCMKWWPKVVGIFILVAITVASLAYFQQLERPFSVWFATVFVLWFVPYIVIMFWPSSYELSPPPTGEDVGGDGQV